MASALALVCTWFIPSLCDYHFYPRVWIISFCGLFQCCCNNLLCGLLTYYPKNKLLVILTTNSRYASELPSQIMHFVVYSKFMRLSFLPYSTLPQGMEGLFQCFPMYFCGLFQCCPMYFSGLFQWFISVLSQ